MTRFEWEPDTPPEIRDVVSPIIDKYHTAIPTWVRVLIINYRANTVLASMETSYRNRWAVLTVGRTFLMESPEERVNAILHEISHIILAPTQRAFELILQEYPEEKKKLAELIYNEGLEAAVSDIAETIRMQHEQS